MIIQDIEVPNDPLEKQYFYKIQEFDLICQKCKHVPFITISKEHPDSIVLNCDCYNDKIVNIKDYLQVTFLENEIQVDKENEKLNNLNVEQISKNATLILNCLSIWSSFLKNANVVKKLFDFDNLFKCVNLTHQKSIPSVEYHCNNCKMDICKQCYNEKEHKFHEVIKLNEYLNMELLDKKKKFIVDAKKIMEKLNEKAYNEIEHLTSKQTKKNKNDTSIIEQFQSPKKELFQLIINNKIINECFYILFLIHFKIYETYSINSCMFFALLKNIEELSHIFIPPSNPFQNNLSFSSESNLILNHINDIHQKIRNSFILTYEEQDSFFTNLQKFNKNTPIHFNQISLRLGRNYSRKSDKKRIIKQILLLNNFDFALATSSKKIKIFNPETMQPVQKYSKHSAPVNYLCSFGFKYFLSCSDDGSVILWKHHRHTFGFNNGIKVIQKLKEIYYVQSYQDDHKVITLENGNIFKVFKTNKNKKPFSLYKTFTQQTLKITSVLIYNDNILISLTNEDNSIRFWDIEEEKLDKNRTISGLDTNDKLNSFKLLNNKMLIIGGKNSCVIVDLYNNSVMMQINGDDISNISAVHIINDMNFIIATKQYFITYNVNMDNIEETKKVSHSQFGNISDICVMLGNNIIISTTTESYINKFTFSLEETSN